MNNRAFTLIETMISLLLLAILVLMLNLILNATSKITTNFLKFTDYEYSLMNKKLFETYEESTKVDTYNNYITFHSKEKKESTRVIFQNTRVYIKKKAEGELAYSGYIVLLENLRGYSLETKEENNKTFVYVQIEDRDNKVRKFRIRLKDDKESEKDDKKDKEE